MSDDEALKEAIQVEKVQTGYVVAVLFHGATEHLPNPFATEAEAQAAGQKRLTHFRVAFAQHQRP